MELFAGTSGFSYAEWKRPSDPADMAGDLLARAGRHAGAGPAVYVFFNPEATPRWL